MLLYRAQSVLSDASIAGSQDFAFRELSVEDFRESPLFGEADRGARYRPRREAGHRCFGFVAPGGEVAAYLWMSFPDMSTAPFELGLEWRLQKDAAYVWDCRTAQEYRNAGLFRTGLRLLRARCAAEGIGRVFIAARSDNFTSQRAIAAAGFTYERTLSVARLPGGMCLVAGGGRLALRGAGGRVALAADEHRRAA